MPEEPNPPPERRLITPPPGLLPPARTRESDAPVNTGSETRRISRDEALPVFLAGAGRVPTPAVPAGRTVWVLRLPDGAEHEITDAGIALGRDPIAPDAAPDARAIPLEDPGRTVSKTHALFRLAGDAARVRDLSSTNGVSITSGASVVRLRVGMEESLSDGDSVALGSVAVLVARRSVP